MTAADDDNNNFFSRWSRRKVQVRSGEALPPEPPAMPVAPVATVVVPPPAKAQTPPAPAETLPEPPPALTLDDVARLTPESDYSAFVARSVPADVRNAAVKKLFTDPHYNVMDGLDIYIDDYSKPSPITAADMAKMVGAQFLKLVDDPNEVKPTAAATSTPDTPPETTAAQQAGSTDAVDDPAVADTRELTAAAEDAAPHDDHADLQLQPDDVPEPPGSGRRAG